MNRRRGFHGTFGRACTISLDLWMVPTSLRESPSDLIRTTLSREALFSRGVLNF